MDISSINSDLIRGNVTTIILRSLMDEDRYGYDILKEIEVKSEGQYKLKQPTLYGCLKRLEKNGLISSYLGDEDQTEGGRRRYYSLTEEGRGYLLKMQSEYEYSRTILDKLLSENEYNFSKPAPFDLNGLRPYTKRRADEDDIDIVSAVKKAASELKNDEIVSAAFDELDDDYAQEEEEFKAPPKKANFSADVFNFSKPAPQADSSTRVVKRTLNDVLNTIDKKVEADQMSKAEPVQEVAASVDDSEPKKPTIDASKFSFTNFKPTKHEPRHFDLSEEEKLRRAEAKNALNIGSTNNYDFSRFGIQPTQKKNDVPADNKGEDPA
jgi:PadR family transcriptional regulator PadR